MQRKLLKSAYNTARIMNGMKEIDEEERHIHIEMIPEEAPLIIDELKDKNNNSDKTRDNEGAECIVQI